MHNIFNYGYSQISSDKNNLFNIDKWKDSEISNNYSTILANLDCPEYLNFLSKNLHKLIISDNCSYLFTPESIDKLIKLDVIDVELLKKYYTEYNLKKYTIFINNLFRHIIKVLDCVDTFNKYVQLLQYDYNIIFELYREIKDKKYLSSENIDIIFSNGMALTDYYVNLYIQIIHKFNKTTKIKNMEKKILEDKMTSIFTTFHVHKYWAYLFPNYKNDFYRKISSLNFNSYNESDYYKYVSHKDAYLYSNLDADDYYNYCKLYNRNTFNYKMMNEVLENQKKIENNLNIIMKKLGLDENYQNEEKNNKTTQIEQIN